MKTKFLVFLCILSIILTLLSGCYDYRGIEDLAYATAMGLDVSEDKDLNLTLQFSIPSSSSESGSSQSSKTDSISVGCSSISSGIGLINSYISKEVNLAHCKVIVMSEELAAKGISEYLDTLANNVEIRPDCNIIISRCPAKDFIKNASPSIETLTARYYEVALNSSEYTGYTTSTILDDFLSAIKSTYEQGHAILGGVNTGGDSSAGGSSSNSSSESSGESSGGQSSNGSETGNTDNQNNGNSSYSEKSDSGSDSNSKANETPIEDSERSRNFRHSCFLW